MEASLSLFRDDNPPPDDQPGEAADPVDGIRIVVFGTPQPAGSKKAFMVGKGAQRRPVIVDDNKRGRPWKDAVTQAAGQAMEESGRELIRGAVELRTTFYRSRPKSHVSQSKSRRGELLPSAPAHPATKPDLTKYVRGAEDALRGVVWKDDSLVVRQVNEKAYGEPERVEIVVLELS